MANNGYFLPRYEGLEGFQPLYSPCLFAVLTCCSPHLCGTEFGTSLSVICQNTHFALFAEEALLMKRCDFQRSTLQSMATRCA